MRTSDKTRATETVPVSCRLVVKIKVLTNVHNTTKCNSWRTVSKCPKDGCAGTLQGAAQRPMRDRQTQQPKIRDRCLPQTGGKRWPPGGRPVTQPGRARQAEKRRGTVPLSHLGMFIRPFSSGEMKADTLR